MIYTINDYIDLIQSFLNKDIGADLFEKNYLAMFKNDETRRIENKYDEFLTLDKLFSDVDAFCSDPSLRDEDDLDEEQLRESSKKALDKLMEIKSKCKKTE